MRRGIVLGLSALAVALVLAPTAPPTGAQSPVAFRAALVGEPPHIDPQRMADFGSATVSAQVYSTLVRVDDKLQIVPLAAQSWSVSKDGLTWTFKLRDNLVFHNGRKADASDVKYSLTRLASPESRSPSSRLLLADVAGFDEVNKGTPGAELTGVRVVDPLTVEIRLTSPPKGDLLPRLSHISTAIIAREAVEKGGANWAETNPIGTGPWKLREWVHRSKVVYDPFPQYFEGKPKPDRLEMPIVPEAATQLAMYQNGELDVVLVPLGDYPRLKRDPRWSKEMREWDRAQTQILALNPRVYAPFKELKVRQAFAQASVPSGSGARWRRNFPRAPCCMQPGRIRPVFGAPGSGFPSRTRALSGFHPRARFGAPPSPSGRSLRGTRSVLARACRSAANSAAGCTERRRREVSSRARSSVRRHRRPRPRAGAPPHSRKPGDAGLRS